MTMSDRFRLSHDKSTSRKLLLSGGGGGTDSVLPETRPFKRSTFALHEEISRYICIVHVYK